jgi:hypothetical protein
MPIDAAGVLRPNLFSIATDPVSGLSFKPMSGRGHYATYQVSGPNVPAGATLKSRSTSPQTLAMEYQSKWGGSPEIARGY